MADQITLEEALELVEFELRPEGWRVKSVRSAVYGNVWGNIFGDVQGDIWGDIWGNVWSTINGRRWKFLETPKEELDQLEDSNG